MWRGWVVVVLVMAGWIAVGRAEEPEAGRWRKIPGPVRACDNATANGVVRCRPVLRGDWYELVDVSPPPPKPTPHAAAKGGRP